MSLVNFSKKTKLGTLIFWFGLGFSLNAESVSYKLIGHQPALAKGLGENAAELAPGALFPKRSLITTSDKPVRVSRLNSQTIITIEKDSVVESLGLDKLDTAQWFFYRGQLEIENSEELLIKAGVAEVLLYPGKAKLVLDENHLFVKSIHGGAMVSTPNYVDGLKSGHEVVVSRSGDIKKDVAEMKTSKGPIDLQDRYQLLGLSGKDQATLRIDLFDGLSFGSKDAAISSALRLLKRHDWTSLLEKGRQQLFVQELMGLEDEYVILPSFMKKHFYDREESDALFEDLEKVESEMSSLPAPVKDEVAFYVRQAMTDPLLSRFRVKDVFKYGFRANVAHDSNVSQDPENIATPSNQSGTSLVSNFNFDFKSRHWKLGQTIASVKIMDLTYFDDAFETREYSKVSVRGGQIFSLGSKMIVTGISPTLGLDSDYLNTDGKRRLTHSTLRPKVDFVFRPFHDLGTWSDLLMIYANIGLDVRVYFKDKDSFDGSKDSVTHNLSLIGVNFKKRGLYQEKMVAVLSGSFADSDAGAYDYDNARLDYIYSISRGNTTLEPSFAYSFRYYDNYLLQKREDDVFEYGLKLKQMFSDKNTELSFGFKHTSRHSKGGSNASLYTYDNNQVFGAVHVKF